MNQILLINDMAGYGKVATAAMLPILSYKGILTYNLPTALVSNTLDYGKFKILETTDYIENVFPVWKELGFTYDVIATGFIVSERQGKMIADYCKEQSSKGTKIFVDPIMGDDGHLYNGVEISRVNVMKEMISVADLISPNYTEATLLTGKQYKENGVTEKEVKELIDGLRELGSKSVLITSVIINGQNAVAGYNSENSEYFIIPFELVPAHFPGTGDMFSAILLSHLMNHENLKPSTQAAMTGIKQMVEINKDQKDKNKGIPVEKCLYLL